MTFRDYAEIIKRNIITSRAINAVGIPINSAGFCKCPFHADKTASMKVYPGSRGFYCFGCHQGGSVIDFVMLYYGVGLKDAVLILNEEFNLRLPIGRAPTREEKKTSEEMQRRRKAEEAERKRQEKIKMAAFERWCDIGKELIELEHDLEDYRPSERDEDFHPKFRKAVWLIPLLKTEAEKMELIFLRKEDRDG